MGEIKIFSDTNSFNANIHKHTRCPMDDEEVISKMSPATDYQEGTKKMVKELF